MAELKDKFSCQIDSLPGRERTAQVTNNEFSFFQIDALLMQVSFKISAFSLLTAQTSPGHDEKRADDAAGYQPIGGRRRRKIKHKTLKCERVYNRSMQVIR